MIGKGMKYFCGMRNGEVMHIPANIYLFKVSNASTRKRCEICLMVTGKAPELLH